MVEKVKETHGNREAEPPGGTETIPLVEDEVTVRENPARGTGTAYEAATSGREGLLNRHVILTSVIC
jgi:hypothetical protein